MESANSSSNIFGGYNLPAKSVLKVEGPFGEKPVDLARCYRRSLQTVLDMGLRSIAFPCIGSGDKYYPKKAAANVALKTVKQFLEVPANQVNIDRVIFAYYDRYQAKAYDTVKTTLFS